MHLHNDTSPIFVDTDACRDANTSTEGPLALEFGMATKSRGGVLASIVSAGGPSKNIYFSISMGIRG